jgi:hypothetical protein
VFVDACRPEGAAQCASEHALEEAHSETYGGVTEALGGALELGEEGQALRWAAHIADGHGLFAGERVVLREELMHVLGVGGAIAKGRLFLLGYVEHFEACDEGGGERLHPGEVVGAAELVGDVRIVELLHDFELHVRIVDICILEETLTSERNTMTETVLPTELKLSGGIRAGGHEAHLILVHGVLCVQAAKGCMQLEFAGLGVREAP